ncbi:MAG: hypothetical protein AAGI38_20540, partial [Bacteroidota bacterium]
QHETLWDSAAKELGMLLEAFGQHTFALTEWSVDQLNSDELIRVGIYADSNQSFIPALEHFRKAIAKDSSDVAPYLEMAKIYNRYKDPAAIENLSYAPAQTSEVKTELAKAHFLQGNIDEAVTLVDQVLKESPDLRSAQLLDLQLRHAQGDTSVLGEAELLQAQYPIWPAALVFLLELYGSKQDWGKGNQLITRAMSFNNQNAELWYQYAVYSRAWSLSEDAGFGAIKAIELTPDPKRRVQIQREFEVEIIEAIDKSKRPFISEG